MAEPLPEPYVARCREAGSWVSAFGLTLLLVHLGLWSLYEGAKPFDLLEPVIFFLGRGIARVSAWSLRWGLVLLLTEALSQFWNIFLFVYFLRGGLIASEEGLPLLGVESLVQQGLWLAYLTWAGGLCWWLWGLLQTHPSERPSRGFAMIAGAILALGLTMAPLFALAQRQWLMGKVRKVERQTLQVGERELSAQIVSRGPDGWEHLGVVVVEERLGDEPAPVDIDRGRSTEHIVMLSGGRSVPARSVMWRAEDGSLEEVASGRSLEWARTPGALEVLMAQWLEEREGAAAAAAAVD